MVPDGSDNLLTVRKYPSATRVNRKTAGTVSPCVIQCFTKEHFNNHKSSSVVEILTHGDLFLQHDNKMTSSLN